MNKLSEAQPFIITRLKLLVCWMLAIFSGLLACSTAAFQHDQAWGRPTWLTMVASVLSVVYILAETTTPTPLKPAPVSLKIVWWLWIILTAWHLGAFLLLVIL